MLRILRQSIIGLLALVLVASSVFARQCSALATSGSASVREQTVLHVEHRVVSHDRRQISFTDASLSAGPHDHASNAEHGHAGYGSDDPSLDTLIGSSCGKNCGMCTIAGTVTLDAPSPVIFAFYAASYVLKTDPISGRFVPIDPGIPKRIS